MLRVKPLWVENHKVTRRKTVQGTDSEFCEITEDPAV